MENGQLIFAYTFRFKNVCSTEEATVKAVDYATARSGLLEAFPYATVITCIDMRLVEPIQHEKTQNRH